MKPKKISTTDPESRYMKGKGVNPSYNMQAAVDVDSRMVVGGYATKNAVDSGELSTVLEDIEETTEGKNPKVLSADKGYEDLKGLQELKEREILGYIAQKEEKSNSCYPLSSFVYDETKDQYLCPQDKPLTLSWTDKEGKKRYVGTACTDCHMRGECLTSKNPSPTSQRSISVSPFLPLRNEMKERMDSEQGLQAAKIRSSTVEPVFGTLKYAKKLRRFCFRGLNMINSQWKFELAALNLEKIVKFRISKQLRTA
ncbi:MAG: transposase [Bdellovibrionales bacterium]|nr:transposase [Bdellovibrionales bacterium]